MIPFIKADRSKKSGSNLVVDKNVGREPTTLDFTMCPTKSSSSRSSLDLRFKGSIHNISQLPVMSLYCFLLVETVFHSLEDASYFLNWLLKLRREKKWVQKEQSNPSEVKWELHNTNMIMLAIGSLNQHIITFFLDLMHDTNYQDQANRRKAGFQHKRIKFPMLRWATYLVMDTVRVHTLYPPFGCNENKNTKRSNEGQKKGVLSSMIDAHLGKIRYGENADAKSAFKAMMITPIFEAWQNKRCPMTLPQFDKDKQKFDGNALSKYLLQFDKLHMGDGICVSHVDYGGDSFTVMQYEKNTQKKIALMKAVKKSASPQTKAKQLALMKAVKRSVSPQTKAKQPALTKAVKIRASPQRKAKKRNPKQPQSPVIRIAALMTMTKMKMKTLPIQMLT
jgi:hypothetical protein